MRWGPRLTSVAALVAIAVASAGCSGSDLITSSGPTAPSTTTRSAPLAPSLAGLTGTAVSSELPDDFVARLRGVDPLLGDTRFSSEAYDAVITLALAAEVAKTDAPTRVAAQVPGVTRDGEKCTTYESCRALTDSADNTGIDYDGVSGPIQLLPNGDVGEAYYDVLKFDPEGSITRLGRRTSRAEPIAAGTTVPVPDPMTGPAPDGHLTIGVVLSRSGEGASISEAERAGVKLAVKDVNAAGGVLGVPVRLLDNDAGAPGSATTTAAVTSQLARGADAIIGTSTNEGTAAILDQVTGAGVILISPSATGANLGVDDHGLFFRLSPSDSLQGSVLAGAVAADGHLAPVLVVERSQFGLDSAVAVSKGLTAVGATARGSLSIDPAAVPADLSAQVAASGADSVVFIGSNQSTGAMMRSMLAAGDSPSKSAWYVTDLGPELGPALATT
jgi:ABC-type branched-subunit amino acid transport system substrate-binding protein